MSEEDTVIAIDDVHFGYGEGGFQLNIPTLSIHRKEHIACTGPSGSGKTTLVNLMAGILLPQRGVVKLGAQEMSALPDSRRRAERISRIGMVFQEFELLDYLSAMENILLPFHIAGVLKLDEAVIARAKRLAAATGIAHVLKQPPGRLSQGERQRVALCRALVTEPEIVMCDEPTGNLDPDTAKLILDLVFQQVREKQATLFMVTHNHAILDRFERVIDMRDLTTRAAS